MFMLWFNDQLLPRANHELATLQMAILRTKPTFALKSQVINTIKEGQLYLRAGYIDRDQSGQMRDVTIYDLNDREPAANDLRRQRNARVRARTSRDLMMRLFDGMMLSRRRRISRRTAQPDLLQAKTTSRSATSRTVFKPIDADTALKGEREMSICEMQKEYESRDGAAYQRAVIDSLHTRVAHRSDEQGQARVAASRSASPAPKAGGIGAMYCSTCHEYVEKYYHVKEAQAAEMRRFTSAQEAHADRPTRHSTAQQDSAAKQDYDQEGTARPRSAPVPAAASEFAFS